MSAASVRITGRQRKAVADVLSESGVVYSTQLIEDIAVAYATAEDDLTRVVVITRDPYGTLNVFGPYASYDTARKVIDGGTLASVEGTVATIKALHRSPK